MSAYLVRHQTLQQIAHTLIALAKSEFNRALAYNAYLMPTTGAIIRAVKSWHVTNYRALIRRYQGWDEPYTRFSLQALSPELLDPVQLCDELRSLSYQCHEFQDIPKPLALLDQVVEFVKPLAAEWARQQERAEQNKRQTERKAIEEMGRILFEQRPLWAQAAVLARREVSDVDTQSDYFASHSAGFLFLGWSKSKRENFREMRKLAGKHPKTAHLGTGCNIYRVALVHGGDFKDSGSFGYEGSAYDRCADDNVFTTRQEAETFLSTQEPHPGHHYDSGVVPVEWRITEKSIEHRENYSMGRGYYLGTDTYSGWQVYKAWLGDSNVLRALGS